MGYCVERVPISSKIDSECDGIVATTSSTTTLDPNLQTQLNLAEYIVAEFGAAEFCRRLLTFGSLEVAQGHKHCSSLLPPEEIQQGMKDAIVEQFGLYVYCVERVPILSVLDAECVGVVATTSTTTIMDPNLQILLNLADQVVAEYGTVEFCRRLLTFGSLEIATDHAHCATNLVQEGMQESWKSLIVLTYGLEVYCTERIPILSINDPDCASFQ